MTTALDAAMVNEDTVYASDVELAAYLDHLESSYDHLESDDELGVAPRNVWLALGTSPGAPGSDEATLIVRRAPTAWTYRSSVVILAVAATLTWLAVVFICLLA